jgi:hypothetical protein
MARVNDDSGAPAFGASSLKPHISQLCLRYRGTDFSRPIPFLMRKARELAVNQRKPKTATILGPIVDLDEFRIEAPDGDRRWVEGFVFEIQSPPSSFVPATDLRNREYAVAICRQRGDLLAVHISNKAVLRRLERWLRSDDLPPFELIPKSVAIACFAGGPTRVVTLRGVHPQQRLKADTQTITGIDALATLNAHHDSSFTYASGTAELGPDAEEHGLHGTIGVVPQRSFTWKGPSADFPGFIDAADAQLAMIGATLASGRRVHSPSKILATQLDGLEAVNSAYGITITQPDSLSPDADTEIHDAARLLHHALLDVHGEPHKPHLTIDVGRNGAVAGQVRCLVTLGGDGHPRFDFRLPTSPRDPIVAEVRDALEHTDLLTIHYGSKHTIIDGGVFESTMQRVPFTNWAHKDFTGYDITREKPLDQHSPDEIHAAIATAGDTSLFAWVVTNHQDGWLICDDRPGEFADFLYLLWDGLLRIIHVKKATSASPRRGVATTQYQEVSAQAIKNSRTAIDDDDLADQLAKTSLANPACWTNGARVPNRDEFIDALRHRPLRAPTEIVIVQPHINEPLVDRLSTEDDLHITADTHRLRLLESLLHGVHAAATGHGADLVVIGSLH